MNTTTGWRICIPVIALVATIPTGAGPPAAEAYLVEPAARDELVELFIESFRHSVDYCDWEEDKLIASAAEYIDGYFSGQRGRPLAASRLARREGKIAGAAMIIETSNGALLDLLFVHHRRQRCGIATLLAEAAVTALHHEGFAELQSRYLLANQASAAWHNSFGFVEEPDLSLAEHRLMLARWELSRREKIGDLTPQDRNALEEELVLRETVVRKLKAIAERDGYEAVTPLLKGSR